MESFFATLKKELVHHEQYQTRAEARASLFEYIEVFYNRIRRHSALNYQISAQFAEAAPHPWDTPLSPSKVMQAIKEKTSRKLLMEFRHLQKQYWGRHLWARRDFVASSGTVTDEVVLEYIRLQDDTEPTNGVDNFQVTPS